MSDDIDQGPTGQERNTDSIVIPFTRNIRHNAPQPREIREQAEIQAAALRPETSPGATSRAVTEAAKRALRVQIEESAAAVDDAALVSSCNHELIRLRRKCIRKQGLIESVAKTPIPATKFETGMEVFEDTIAGFVHGMAVQHQNNQAANELRAQELERYIREHQPGFPHPDPKTAAGGSGPGAGPDPFPGPENPPPTGRNRDQSHDRDGSGKIRGTVPDGAIIDKDHQPITVSTNRGQTQEASTPPTPGSFRDILARLEPIRDQAMAELTGSRPRLSMPNSLPGRVIAMSWNEMTQILKLRSAMSGPTRTAQAEQHRTIATYHARQTGTELAA